MNEANKFNFKKNAKVLLTLLAVLMLAGFPIGTFIGVYLLMNNFGWEAATN